jgi:hypothetical protein
MRGQHTRTMPGARDFGVTGCFFGVAELLPDCELYVIGVIHDESSRF